MMSLKICDLDDLNRFPISLLVALSFRHSSTMFTVNNVYSLRLWTLFIQLAALHNESNRELNGANWPFSWLMSENICKRPSEPARTPGANKSITFFIRALHAGASTEENFSL